MTHADPPRRTVTVRAENADVTTKVDETVAQAVTQAKRRRGIGGVFLAEAAEVELHAGERQGDARPLPLHALPADQRQQRRQSFSRRYTLRAEIPRPAQPAGRNVEQAVALAPRGSRIIEQRRG